MLLAIDAGNTNIVFAVCDGETIRAEWRAATKTSRTADEYAVWLSGLLELQGMTFADLDEAKLLLTEALIRESLRAGKLQLAEPEEENPDGDNRPRRGPGRFRGPAKQKNRPLVPAGVQTQFKKTGATPKPRIGRPEGD